MTNYSDKYRRICFSNNIVPYIDIIDKFLKDFTKERIEKGNLLLSTYAKIFMDSCPFDEQFDSRVNDLLDDQNYIIDLETRRK